MGKTKPGTPLWALNRIHSNEDGVSLIEAAIGLIILGLILMPLIHTYRIQKRAESFSMTRGALANMQDALNQYHLGGTGAFPCPADLTLAEEDDDYGVSRNCDLAGIPLCTDNWENNGGICKTEDSLSAVIVGALPFATLKFQANQALDYWGNKLIYAVSFTKTDPATFSSPPSVRAKVVDNPTFVRDGLEDGIPDILSQRFEFILFSTGATGYGGFTAQGRRISDCPELTEGYDAENCNFDSVFFLDTDPNIMNATAFSEVPGPFFYDDITRGQDSIPEATWFQDETTANIEDGSFTKTISSRIGIGTTNPEATVDVNGDIRIRTKTLDDGSTVGGRLKSDTMCDIDGNNCFDPELITGQRNEMNCDKILWQYIGRQPVMQIANNRVYCGGAQDASGPSGMKPLHVDLDVFQQVECTGNERASGINSNGEIICVDATPAQ